MRADLSAVRPVAIRAGICDHVAMPIPAALSPLLLTVFAAVALVGCAPAVSAPEPGGETSSVIGGGATESPVSAPTAPPAPTPDPTYITELPDSAAENVPWFIYPDGFECWGTEGCPNDFRSVFGDPGPVLPEGVEYYDPAKHECVYVRPADVTC